MSNSPSSIAVSTPATNASPAPVGSTAFTAGGERSSASASARNEVERGVLCGLGREDHAAEREPVRGVERRVLDSSGLETGVRGAVAVEVELSVLVTCTTVDERERRRRVGVAFDEASGHRCSRGSLRVIRRTGRRRRGSRARAGARDARGRRRRSRARRRVGSRNSCRRRVVCRPAGRSRPASRRRRALAGVGWVVSNRLWEF